MAKLIALLLVCFSVVGQTLSVINTGTTSNDGTGDSLRTAFTKANTNFYQLWSEVFTNIPVDIANAGGAGKLDATNGTAVALTGSLTNVTINGAAPATANVLGSYFAVGDSITAGFGATAVSNRYANVVSASLGTTLQNLGVSTARGASDGPWSLVPGIYIAEAGGTAPTTVSSNSFATIQYGVNDAAYLSSDSYLASFRRSMRYMATWLGLSDSAKQYGTASGVAKTGTWTTWGYFGGMAAVATNSTDTLTFTNLRGSAIYLSYVGTASNDIGSFSVTIDGVARGTPSITTFGNRNWTGSASASIPTNFGVGGVVWQVPQTVRFGELLPQNHTLVVTATGATPSTPVIIMWAAANSDPLVTTGRRPQVLIGGPPDIVATAAATTGKFVQANSELATELFLDGLSVSYVPVMNWYSTTNTIDGTHPNDAGMRQLATAYLFSVGTLADVRTAPQYSPNFLTYSYDGTLGLTNIIFPGTTEFVGRPTFDTTIWVLPNAIGGGNSSLFGRTSSSDSAIVLTHGALGVDRRMRIGGNTIDVVSNSAGAAATLSLGSASGTVAIVGPATVGSGLTVTGATSLDTLAATNTVIRGTLTASGQSTFALPIRVQGAAAPSGNSSLFGTTSATNSAVVITADSEGIDRRLVLSGNSVAALVNSTGGNANLTINASGTTTTIGGALSVGQTLAVTGASTFTGNAGMSNATVAGTLGVTGQATFGTRLLVQTTPAGGGNSTLFGTTSTTNSAVVVVADDTTTNRRLTLTGNSIAASANDTGTPANLTINSAGTTVTVGGALSVGSTIELGNASDTTLARSAAGVVTIEGVTVAERPTTTALTYSGTNVTLTATSHVLHGNTLTLTNNCLLTITSSDGASGGITIVPHSSTSYTVYLDSAIKLLGGGSSFVVTNSASETVNLEWKQTLRGGSSVILANKAVYP